MAIRIVVILIILMTNMFTFETIFAVEQDSGQNIESLLCENNTLCDLSATIMQNIWAVTTIIILIFFLCLSLWIIIKKNKSMRGFDSNLKQFLVVGFIDISNFSSTSTDSDLEQIRKLFVNFSTEFKKILSRHGGKITKLQGDGILFYFEESDRKEYDFTNILDFYLDMVNSIKRFDELTNTQNFMKMKYKVGLTYGPAKTYFDSTGHADILGHAVNLNSKIIDGLSRKQSQICFNSNLFDILKETEKLNNTNILQNWKKRQLKLGQKYHDFYILGFEQIK